MSEESINIDNNIVAKKITLPKNAPRSSSFATYVPHIPEPERDAVNPKTTTVPYIAPTEGSPTIKDTDTHDQLVEVRKNISSLTDPEQNEKTVTPDMSTIVDLQMSYVSLDQQLHEPPEKAQEESQVQTDSLQPTVEQETVEEERTWMLLQKQHTSYIDGIR